MASANSRETSTSVASDLPPCVVPVCFRVNGNDQAVALDSRTTLLDALREHLHLTGSKKGCDHGSAAPARC
jgi:xanthine dehydrogenase YagT iron-sulfur-binding subunit